MARRDMLDRLSFGRVDAESVKDLTQRFVRTADFDALMTGDVALVLGPKGTGKSAIFELLQQFEGGNRSGGVYGAGNVIFVTGTGLLDLSEVSSDDIEALRNEPDFDYSKLWRLYVAIKVATAIKDDAKSSNGPVRDFLRMSGTFQDPRLLPLLATAWRAIISPNAPDDLSISGYGVALSAKTSGRSRSLDVIELLRDADSILEQSNKVIWVLFDKIDELLPADKDARRAALEGLMLTVMNIRRLFPRIQLKIFLRTDIWSDLNFTNKSHLVDKTIRLSWSRRQIAALLAKGAAVDTEIYARMVAASPRFRSDDAETLPNSVVMQALREVLPPLVRHRKKSSPVINFMFDRIRDARDDAFPREAILWANWARDIERHRRAPGPESDPLLSSESLVSSFANVSSARCGAYLAEFPQFRDHFARFEGEKGPVFTKIELAEIFDGLIPSGVELYRTFYELGVLKPLGGSVGRAERFEVPMLYRHGLSLSTTDRD